MHPLQNLFDQNRAWASDMEKKMPGFFQKLSAQQKPEYLWIGCSDSRVPANEIVGLLPGELFVHRNVANLVLHIDVNCLSVLQYAVDNLKVRHVIVCGHYGCGGVRAAMDQAAHGLIDNWLRHIQNIHRRNRQELDAITDPDARCNRLCELNVIQQVMNLGCTTILQDAWSRGQAVAVHGWIYGLNNGLIKDLGVTLRSQDDVRKLDAGTTGV